MKLIDAENTLIVPNLHDCNIVGFNIDLDGHLRSMSLILRSEQGLEYNLEFFGIIHLSCQRFYIQNVVAEVLVWEKMAAFEQIESYYSVFGFSNVADMRSSLKTGNNDSLALVHIIPSIGVEIVCLSESFSAGNITV